MLPRSRKLVGTSAGHAEQLADAPRLEFGGYVVQLFNGARAEIGCRLGANFPYFPFIKLGVPHDALLLTV